MRWSVQLTALLLLGACSSAPGTSVGAPDPVGGHVDAQPDTLELTDAGAGQADLSEGDAVFAATDLAVLDLATTDATQVPLPIIPTQLRWSLAPVNGPAGPLGTLVVTATDDLGQVATDFTTDITVSIATGPSGSILDGNTTEAAPAGVAAFPDLAISRKGTYQLRASASGLSDAVSSDFDLWGSRLVFTRQPVDVKSKQTFPQAIAVAVEDGDGNIDAGFQGTLALSLTGTSGATLFGTTARPLQNGVAIFPGLSIDLWGERALHASIAGLPPADSGLFRTTCSRLQVDPPTSAIAGVALDPGPQVRCVDETGATDQLASEAVFVGAFNGFGTCPWQDAVGSFALQAGVADLAGLAWFKAATQCSLNVSTPTYLGGSAGPFDIVAAGPAGLHLAIPDVAHPAGAGIPFALDAQIVDAFGNVANVSGVSLTLSSGDPLTNLGTLPSVDGHAVFSNVVPANVGAATVTLSASGYADDQQQVKVGAWGYLPSTSGFGYLSFDISPGDAGDVVVYANGVTRRSHDGGATFSSVAVPNRFYFAPSNASIIYRFGAGSILGFPISRSSDGGISWTDLAYSPSSVMMTVAPTNPDVILLVDRLLRSDDGAATLKPVLGNSNWWVAWARDGSVVYAQHGTTLLRSTDLGQTWSTRPAVPSSYQIAVDFYLPSRLLSSNLNGTWLSSDGGATWVDLAPRLPSGATSATLHPGVSGGLLARVGSVYVQSIDDGTSWTPYGDETTPLFFRISATDPLIGYAQGVEGGLLKTLTGGAQ